MATINANPLFRLRRQEDIVASMINYVSGHTPRITDFSEGSIIRSMIEGVGQEIFRQNVVFAQDIADSIKEAIRQAFGLPLLAATKAYGVVRFFRQMLESPTAVTPTLVSTTTGHLSTTSLTKLNDNSTYKVTPATYTYASSGGNNVGTIVGTATVGSVYYSYLTITNPIANSIYAAEEGMKIEALTSLGVVITAPGTTGYCGANAFVKDVVTSNAQKLVLWIQSTSAPTAGSAPQYRLSQSALPSSKTYYYSVAPAFCGKGLELTYKTSGTPFTIDEGYAGTGYSTGDTVIIMGGTSITTVQLTVSSTTGLVTAATVVGSIGTGLTNNVRYSTCNQTIQTTGIPSAPISQELAIAETNYTISFNASDVDGAHKYIVYRADNPYFLNASTWFVSHPYAETITQLSIADSGHQQTTILPYPGNTWSWAVKANNISGSSLAGYNTISPSTTQRTSAQITWEAVDSIDSQSAVTSYTVYRSSCDVGKEIPSSVSVTGLYTGSGVSGLTPGTNYWYSISAIYSDRSESVGSSPVLYKAAEYYVYGSISWNPIADAIGYRIYRSNLESMADAKFVEFYNAGQESYIDTGSVFINTAYRWTNLATVGVVTSQTTINGDLLWAITDEGHGGTFNYGSFQNTSTLFTDTLPLFPTAQSISGNIVIGAGTRVRVPGTIKYYTVPYQQIMDASANDISIIVEAQSYGKLFNTEYNTIKELTDKIYGINVVYNDDAISNGQDVETEEEWRIRFSKTVQGLSRGTVSSVESGALTAKVLDNNGFITEFVQKVLVQETSASSLRITIHNGKNYETSQALVSECKKIVDGYTDTDGVYQPGYKPAGVTVSVYPAFFQSQNLYITVSSESNIASQYVKSSIVDSIQKYFLSLDISDGFAPASAMAYANTTGSTEYSYRIVCVDTSGNKSLPSDVVLVPNGNATPNNTVRWSYTALDGAPTVGSYDILRWDPTYETWRLVANVGGSVSEYVDINTDLSEYAFFPPRKKVFQRSELTKILMSISGVSSIRLYLDAKSKYISLSSRRGTGLTVDTTILGGSGVISAISVHSGSAGTNYAIGDVIQISGGITPAYAMISSVNVNTGAVVSIVVMDGGTGYASSATDVPVSWPIPTEPSVVVPPAGYVLTPGIVSIQ